MTTPLERLEISRNIVLSDRRLCIAGIEDTERDLQERRDRLEALTRQVAEYDEAIERLESEQVPVVGAVTAGVDQTYYDDQTLGKVYEALVSEGYATTEITDMVNAMQNAGILFRERGPEPQGEPSDARVYDAEVAFWAHKERTGIFKGAMRAALRAAGGVR